MIDKQNLERVCRVPLYDMQSLDVRIFESDHEVGVCWIKLNWQEKLFVISMPEWEECWVNMFVSNAPYVHFKS